MDRIIINIPETVENVTINFYESKEPQKETIELNADDYLARLLEDMRKWRR